MATHLKIDHSVPVAEAKALPGVWTFVASYATPDAGEGAAHRIPRARRMPSYAPAGSFEAYAAPHEDGGTAVWARYVVGVADLEPRPKTRTYRVCDRGTGPEYVGVRPVTVTIAAECPRCGGPRGEAKHHRFCEDGEWYSVDTWANPCGHEDAYEAVLAEYRARLRRMEELDTGTSLSTRPDGTPWPDPLDDRRPLPEVAAPRIERSADPVGFRAHLVRSTAAVCRGEDLATAAWTADNPLQLAAEIEALAGARRLAYARTRKGSK
ncbi:hypothetical protein ABZ593_21280 [Streptomyces sp. NPDC012617]|uniref:hypothetical protein n=1 Tax=Streptomyces TaxID=1883 RepID=UPI0033D6FD80